MNAIHTHIGLSLQYIRLNSTDACGTAIGPHETHSLENMNELTFI